MDDALEVDLREFDKLRDEVLSRQHTMTAVMTAELTVLAAAISVNTTFPDALVGGAVALACLWAVFTAQRRQVLRLGTYIRAVLTPRVRDRVNDDQVLGWEPFLRDLAPNADHLTRTPLFALAPIGLLAAFVASQHNAWSCTRWAITGTAVAVYLLAAYWELRLYEERQDLRRLWG